jgi:UDP-glucose 4-epimerase
VTNTPKKRVFEGRRAGDPASLISDPTLIRKTLPWEPQYADLDTIITHALAWERKLTELRGHGS